MGLVEGLVGSLLALAAPHGIHVDHDLAYGPGPRERLDVYRSPTTPPGAPMAVFIYGGSWQSGDKGFYRFVGAILASRGIVTVIPDYRVYPAAVYPAFLRDNAQAVRFAIDHAGSWGANPRRTYLVGHSAGAYDVAMLGVDPRWLGEVGLDPAKDIAGVVGLAGPYDFLPLRDKTLKIIFGPPSGRADTQPINHVTGVAPPMLLLAGSADKVVDPGNTTRLGKAITAHGGVAEAKIIPGVGHVGILTALLEPFRGRAPVLDEIVDFVSRTPTQTKLAA